MAINYRNRIRFGMEKHLIRRLASASILLALAIASPLTRADISTPTKTNATPLIAMNKNSKVYLNSIKFSKNRLLVAMKRWGEIKVTITAEAGNPIDKWVDDCRIKLYIGYNNLGKDGRMLAFQSSCKVFTLPNATEQNMYFYLPGDLRKRYNLTKDPDFYVVRLTIDGTKMPLGEKECSKSLETPQKREEFYKKIKTEADLLISGLYNANQLPPYADIKVEKQPTLRRTESSKNVLSSF
ncbi:MAG: hypothetical protein LBH49_03430 [Puniceicoccales bacterium]|nr:hypothetical protein [Puniceicoccales bacterium]